MTDVIIDSTTDVSEKNLVYAGIGNRFLAEIIDGLIYLAFISVMNYLIIGSFLNTSSNRLLTFSQYFILFLYVTFMQSSRYQGTLGKMAMKIKVATMEGNRISYANAVGRYFAKGLSGIILGIGYFMAFFNPKKQALHDRWAHTVVVV